MTDTPDPSLVPLDVAARLLMIAPTDLTRIIKAGWITPEVRNPDRFRLVALVQGFLRHLESERNPEATGTALAAHLFCTRETLSDYVARGVVEKLPNGKYDLNACRERVMRHLRDRAAGRAGDNGDNLASARADLAREQRDAVAIKNAIARGDFVPLGAMAKKIESRNSVVRERLLVIPGKMADALAMREREEIAAALTDEIEEVLNELAEPGTTGGVQPAD